MTSEFLDKHYKKKVNASVVLFYSCGSHLFSILYNLILRKYIFLASNVYRYV